MKTILVTGSAGFIGSNLVLRLFKELSEGTIVGSLQELNMSSSRVIWLTRH